MKSEHCNSSDMRQHWKREQAVLAELRRGMKEGSE